MLNMYGAQLQNLDVNANHLGNFAVRNPDKLSKPRLP